MGELYLVTDESVNNVGVIVDEEDEEDEDEDEEFKKEEQKRKQTDNLKNKDILSKEREMGAIGKLTEEEILQFQNIYTGGENQQQNFQLTNVLWESIMPVMNRSLLLNDN